MKKQIRTDKVDKLLKVEKFITWDMIGASVLNRKNYVSDEAKEVFDYMKELGMEFMRYGDKYSDGKMDVNNRGFAINIKKVRKRKIQKIYQKN